MSQNKPKIAVIGAGSRGIISFGIPINNRADAELAALCDPNPARLRIMVEKFKMSGCRTYTSTADLFKNEQLDAVVVTSPDFCHEENVITALNNKVNVLVDKPLATTVKACRNIINTAETAGKTVIMGFNLRHNNVLKKLKKIVTEGVLGRIFLIENSEYYDGGRTYMARWNRKYAISGGLWVHKGSHDFDVFNWLLDFPRPVMVSAFAGNDVFNKNNIPFTVKPGIEVGPTCSECAYKNECPDVTLRDITGFTGEAFKFDNYAKDLCIYTSDKDVHDNGIAIVQYENGAKASHMECFITSLTDRFYRVVGTRGQAEVSLHNRRITIHPRWGGEIQTIELPEETGGHSGADFHLVNFFLDVISGKKVNNSTIEHGLWSTAIGQAAELSWREERRVMIDELF